MNKNYFPCHNEVINRKKKIRQFLHGIALLFPYMMKARMPFKKDPRVDEKVT